MEGRGKGESKKKPPRFSCFWGKVRTPPDALVLGCKFRK